MKRKTNTLYGQSHSGAHGFSLNGWHRNLSSTGRESKRDSVRTLFRGDVPRGHGGCCGSYPVTILSTPNQYFNSDLASKEIIPSVKNTQGLLDTSVLPKQNWVQPETVNDSGEYIQYKRNKSIHNNSCNQSCPSYKDRISKYYYMEVGARCVGNILSTCNANYRSKDIKYNLPKPTIKTGKGCVCI